MRNTIGLFFAKWRWKSFKTKTDREICDRILAHLQGEGDYGYPFRTDAEMQAQTAQLNIHSRLANLERQIQNMPQAYGASFRHIMHRELNERLRLYEQLARLRTNRTCDPRFVATHA